MQNALHEILPRKVRLWIYVVVFLCLLGLGSYNAAAGDVPEAIFGFLTSLAPLLAAGNLTPADATPAPAGYTPKHRKVAP